MNIEKLIEEWKKEESIAKIKGWDFSHIRSRYSEDIGLPWDYREKILEYLTKDMKLLDIDTGGGEFLTELGHPFELLSATEAYPPNAELCSRILPPLGIDFRIADGKGRLPFDDDFFDMVINRHGDYNPEEIYRVLKKGGIFITQQVGAENDRELAELLTGREESPFPEQYLNIAEEKFRRMGFEITEKGEAFPVIEFYDIGALVWFARIIEWEFPEFSVERNTDNLLDAQRMLERDGRVKGHAHRFMLIARKP